MPQLDFFIYFDQSWTTFFFFLLFYYLFLSFFLSLFLKVKIMEYRINLNFRKINLNNKNFFIENIKKYKTWFIGSIFFKNKKLNIDA